MAADKKTKLAAPETPPKLAALVREAWWIALVTLGVFLSLILVTYNLADAGFSRTGSSSAPHNAGGALGAWLSDALLAVFGFSAWWLVVLLFATAIRSFRRIEVPGLIDRRSLAVAGVGFLMTLAASCALEALRLQGWHVTLPSAHGGIVGNVLGTGLFKVLGFTGATLILVVLLAIGISLFTGLSWLGVAERCGKALETFSVWLPAQIHAWRDRRAGETAQVEREVHLSEARKLEEEREPLLIAAPPPEITRSERVVKEKQVPLFEDLPDSDLPPLALLDAAEAQVETVSAETLEYTSRLIERKLAEFNVEVKVLAAYPGPVITRFEIEPAVGVKGSQIVNLVKDLARSLSVPSVRVVETIPNKSCMGLEIPNPKRQVVRLAEIVSSKVYAEMNSALAIALGKDIGGHPVVADLARMPHILVAGTTGSGKSVALNAMILSLVYKATPNQARMLLIDPKMLELSVYEGIPHLLAPVVTDMKQAANALNWCIAEMERRYRVMSALGVRNLAGYNQKIQEAEKAGEVVKNPLIPTDNLLPEEAEAVPPLETLPLIVVVIDELADLMMVVGKKVEELIARLAQKARASGIHLILATQRPSVDVITGLIKANIPTRVAFQVASRVDSRTILDQMGAEALLGQGDMLYLPPGVGYPTRVHGAFVSDQEVHRVVEFLKRQGEPNYIAGVLESGEAEEGAEGELIEGGGEADALYDQAVQIVLKTRRPSISLVQRHLRIGYNRAARLIEQMERAGLVSPMQSNGNREVLVPATAERS